MTRTGRSRRLAGCRGFSLLEVVVAFSILALSLGALYQIFSSAAERARVLEAYNGALLLAEAKLASVAAEDPLAPGSLSGEFDGTYRWRSTVEALAAQRDGNAAASLQPYRVTVEVSWGAGDRASKVALTTMRLGL